MLPFAAGKRIHRAACRSQVSKTEQRGGQRGLHPPVPLSPNPPAPGLPRPPNLALAVELQLLAPGSQDVSMDQVHRGQLLGEGRNFYLFTRRGAVPFFLIWARRRRMDQNRCNQCLPRLLEFAKKSLSVLTVRFPPARRTVYPGPQSPGR